jgi:hypothetical protein
VVFLRVHTLYLPADSPIRSVLECGVILRQFSKRYATAHGTRTCLRLICSAFYRSVVNGWWVTCKELLKCLLCFPTWNIVTCILCMDLQRKCTLSVILFTDEASFTQDGINNSRNVQTRTHENPRETRVTNFQRRFSVNVWCGVLGEKLIGPLRLTTI